ncbi:molybdopterin-dependent oxidoreductase [Catellatospora sp. KI3]|uniref:molybdopterin-dependent oxidoreductase n=1 Tax=Catellatospora sp. KI3 TaxID=3041620 RepID=UPI0024830595|nr:molybdopterin-dependent oxidoreductase [Catellatospora sp. KI3]MDI1460916.1 molybdopterin-dependent oxidoreductase [Catellatospora sp. KI3]
MRILNPGTTRSAAAGVLAAAAGSAAAELCAALLRPESSPLIGIGSTVIDATPTPAKEYAVRTFGAYDKPLLLIAMAAVLVLLAGGLGMVARRRPRSAQAAAAALGVLAAAAVVSRPAAAPLDAVPSLLAGAVAAVVLGLLTGPLGAPGPAAATVPADRRRFLLAAGAVAGSSLAVGGVAATIRVLTSGSAERAREAITLPPPVQPAGPRNTTPGFYTPVTDFYRVDTALTLPRVDVRQWRLRIHGMVDRPLTLDFEQLLARGLIERDITLNCVSNEVGGPYIGTTRWLGVPLAPLLRQAGVGPGADQVVARSADGMTLGTPVETVLDGRDAMLAVGMDGRPLPPEHGFPVRMLTPGVYGYAGSCKWITELELARFADFDPYWVRRGWARHAPVRTASRIDRPAPFAEVAAGTVAVAGVAWAQGRGIRAVELQVDDGPWQQVELLPGGGADTWVQWRYRWQAAPGGHRLRVRATDGTGRTQPERRATPFPDGATGWHTLAVTAT